MTCKTPVNVNVNVNVNVHVNVHRRHPFNSFMSVDALIR